MDSKPNFPEKLVAGYDPAMGEDATFQLSGKVAEFLDRKKGVPFMELIDELAAFFPKLEKSGFFDIHPTKLCNHPDHGFPSHLYIPFGKGYRHVCPSCGNVTTVIPQQITF